MPGCSAPDRLVPSAIPYELRRDASPGRAACLELDCPDDEQAILQAWRHAAVQPVEVWQGSRLVCRLEPAQPEDVTRACTIPGNQKTDGHQLRLQTRLLEQQPPGTLPVDESNFPVSVHSSILSSPRIPLFQASNSFDMAGSDRQIRSEGKAERGQHVCTMGGSAA